MRHLLLGIGVGLVHDDLVDFLRIHARDPAHALDAAVVRARGVGAIFAHVIPAMAFLAAPRALALSLAARRIGRMGLIGRFLQQDRGPIVVQLPAAGNRPDIGWVMGVSRVLIFIAIPLGLLAGVLW
jgi:hypothetical protein